MKTVAIDFDGVVHLNHNFVNSSIIPDAPVPGAFNAIEQLRRQYRVVIFSCRADSPAAIDAISDWLEVNGIEVDEVTNVKPHATVYIDDRAINFAGDWQDTLEQIEGFKPWQYNQAPGKTPIRNRKRSRYSRLIKL